MILQSQSFTQVLILL
ncbi:Protein of unknown function [Pyronema omphalodes CBS 100304]|uniref:Uncharacterized protein n=1 Tax=Pyronema omphalodes (strain CBS 100304) TaxID=1076935 RepID=U4LE15_PYROM|nr:Protein of unknown function [Pyronema omphalodes CBS 100304]